MITFAGDITQDSSENNERKLETGNADLPATGRTGQLRRHPDEYNLLTVAWTGTVCTNPPMCYISVRPERHSYDIIRRTGEFVINLTTEELARATDWCGVRSGRDHDKFRETGLTPVPATVVKAPVVAEAPVDRMPRTTDPTVRIARPVSGRSGEYPGRQPLHRLRNG